MSLDLDWSLLDGELADSLLARLNRSLSTASRPDFLGPITLTSLDFGDDAPEVRLTGISDVWRQFMDVRGGNKETDDGDDDEAVMRNAAGVPRRTADANALFNDPEADEDDDDEGVTMPGEEGLPSRRKSNRPSEHLTKFAEQSNPFTNQGAHGPRIHTFRQYTPSDIQQVHGGASGSVASFPASTSMPAWAANGGSGSVSGSIPSTPLWGAGLGTRGPIGGSGYFSPWQAHSQHAASGPGTGLAGLRPGPTWRRTSTFLTETAESSGQRDVRSPSWGPPQQPDEAIESSTAIPSLQMQLSVVWSTNTLKLGINTSLLINHPTPAFMELPLSVAVTGLGLQAGCVVAFEEGEGQGRKIHLSLVEDEAEEEVDGSPVSVADMSDENATAGRMATTTKTSPPSANGGPPAKRRVTTTSSLTTGAVPLSHQQQQRPLTVGERLIPRITIDSSVGQADKHVLRNVGKVEKFLVELLRKAVEDELVWPNFYTIALS